jgi:hypothetical protein
LGLENRPASRRAASQPGVDADVLRTGDCGRKDEDKQKKQTAIAIH